MQRFDYKSLRLSFSYVFLCMIDIVNRWDIMELMIGDIVGNIRMDFK